MINFAKCASLQRSSASKTGGSRARIQDGYFSAPAQITDNNERKMLPSALPYREAHRTTGRWLARMQDGYFSAPARITDSSEREMLLNALNYSVTNSHLEDRFPETRTDISPLQRGLQTITNEKCCQARFLTEQRIEQLDDG
jgi:hypothetical protein